MANNPQISVDVTPSLATTTDGTSTVTVLTSPMHDSTGAESITYDVLGHDFSNNEMASAKIVVKVTNTGGTLAMVGTPVHLVPINVGSSPGLITASVNVAVVGSNVVVNVIGVTGRTIKWVAYRNAAIEVLNSWAAVPTPGDGYVPSWSVANARWEPVPTLSTPAAGGDVSGTYPTLTVEKINGTSVPAAHTTNQVLVSTGATSSVWSQIYDGYVASSAAIAGTKIAPAFGAQNISTSGSLTVSSLGTGIVHSNGSGVFSSSAVNLASADVTGELPLTNMAARPYAQARFGNQTLSSNGDKLIIAPAATDQSFYNGITIDHTNYRLTVATGGIYYFIANLNLTYSDSVYNEIFFQFYLNDFAISNSITGLRIYSATNAISHVMTALVPMDANNFIDIRVYSGASALTAMVGTGNGSGSHFIAMRL